MSRNERIMGFNTHNCCSHRYIKETLGITLRHASASQCAPQSWADRSRELSRSLSEKSKFLFQSFIIILYTFVLCRSLVQA